MASFVGHRVYNIEATTKVEDVLVCGFEHFFAHLVKCRSMKELGLGKNEKFSH